MHTNGQGAYVKYSVALVLKGVLIKITVRNQVTPTRMVVIWERIENSKFCQGWRETETLLHHWWKCKMTQPLWESWVPTEHPKHEAATRHNNSAPMIHPRITENGHSHKNLNMNVWSISVHNLTMETTKMSVKRWMDKHSGTPLQQNIIKYNLAPATPCMTLTTLF